MTFIVTPLVIVGTWFWLTVARGSGLSRVISKRGIPLAGLFAAMSAGVFFIGLPKVDVQDWITLRVATMFETPPYARWQILFEEQGAFLIGRGLRSAEVILGQYSEISYLDLAFELGVVGLVTWLGLTALVSRQFLRYVRTNPLLLPWMMTWLFLLLMLLTMSFRYHPFYWMNAAAALGQRRRPRPADEVNASQSPEDSAPELTTNEGTIRVKGPAARSTDGRRAYPGR